MNGALNKAYNEISLFSCIIAFVLTSVYLLLRLGFNDLHLQSAIETLGISLLILTAPGVIIERLTKRDQLFSSDAFLSLCVLISLVCIGSLVSIFEKLYAAKWIVAFTGYVFFIILSIKVAQLQKSIYIIIHGSIAVLLSIWVFSVFWGYGPNSPLYFESFAVKLPHIDTLFHLAIGEMIKTYHVPSIGIEGIIYLPYHFGSHYAFAQLSFLLGQDLLIFYPLAFPVIFLPLLFKMFLGLTATLKETISPGSATSIFRNFWFWLLFFSGFAGFLHVNFLNKAGSSSCIILLSESYSVSLILMFALFSLLLIFWKKYNTHEISFRQKITFLFLAAPTLLALLGLSKISTLFITVALLGYCFLRLKLYKDKAIILSYVLISLVSISIFLITYDLNSGDGQFSYFHYIKNYIQVPAIVFALIFYVWIFILAILLIFRVHKGKELKVSFFKLDFLALELTLVAAVAGFLPGAILNIAGGSALYFMEPQYWIGLCCVLAYWSGNLILFANKPVLNKIMIYAFAALLLFSLARNIRYQFITLVFKHLTIRKNIWDETNKVFEIDVLLREIFTKDKSMIENLGNILNQPQAKIQHDREFQFFTSLRSLKEMPEKAKTLLFIENKHNLHIDFPCQAIPFAIPALTGMATLRGAPYDYCPITGYGFNQFPLENKTEIGKQNHEKDLCHQIGELNFEKLIILNYSEYKIDSIRTVNCHTPASH